jgi:hypothetical protein
LALCTQSLRNASSALPAAARDGDSKAETIALALGELCILLKEESRVDVMSSTRPGRAGETAAIRNCFIVSQLQLYYEVHIMIYYREYEAKVKEQWQKP